MELRYNIIYVVKCVSGFHQLKAVCHKDFAFMDGHYVCEVRVSAHENGVCGFLLAQKTVEKAGFRHCFVPERQSAESVFLVFGEKIDRTVGTYQFRSRFPETGCVKLEGEVFRVAG